MSRTQMRVLAGLALLLVAGTAQAAGTIVAPLSGNVMLPKDSSCNAMELCVSLEHSINNCRSIVAERSCAPFLEAVKELIPITGCKRSGDQFAVPGIWLCPGTKGVDGLHETFTLLRSLPFDDARTLYQSPEFGKVLNGEMLKQYKQDKVMK